MDVDQSGTLHYNQSIKKKKEQNHSLIALRNPVGHTLSLIPGLRPVILHG